MTKNQLRQYAKEIRAGMDAQERERLSAAMCARLLPILQDKKPETIGLYYPIGSEISPLSIREKFKTVLPVIRQDKSLEFYEWEEGAKLVKRDFDIPIPDTRRLSPIDPDILIMPLLLCDAQGNRIGYGKGHYDRYIASREPRPFLIGVCFDKQIYDTPIEAEAHDVRLDMIVTPNRVIEIQ